MGKRWLVEGTTFTKKVDFTFSDEGLILYFPPYQVAPFAFGSWEVTGAPHTSLTNPLMLRSLVQFLREVAPVLVGKAKPGQAAASIWYPVDFAMNSSRV